MKYEDILSKIQQGDLAPIYFLYGTEPFFIDSIADALEKNVIDPTMKDFNQTVLYGGDIDASALLETLRRYPMMSDRQLVVLREAHAMRDFEQLETYFERPAEHTIFAICYKKKGPDKRKSFTKKLLKASLSFESKPLYDNQVPQWINTSVTSHGHVMDNKATTLLAQYLGTDLSKIANALNKLYLNIPASKTITPEDIEKYIGISKDFNIFELQKALSYGDTEQVFRIIHFFKANPKDHPLQMIIPSLHSFFSKLMTFHSLKDKSARSIQSSLGLPSPYFVRDYQAAAKRYSIERLLDINDTLLEYDLKSKGHEGGQKTNEALLDELILKVV